MIVPYYRVFPVCLYLATQKGLFTAAYAFTYEEQTRVVQHYLSTQPAQRFVRDFGGPEMLPTLRLNATVQAARHLAYTLSGTLPTMWRGSQARTLVRDLSRNRSNNGARRPRDGGIYEPSAA